MSAEAASSTEGTEPTQAVEESSSDEALTLEERVIQWTIIVLIPFLITFIAFGVIILAYSEWKLY